MNKNTEEEPPSIKVTMEICSLTPSVRITDNNYNEENHSSNVFQRRNSEVIIDIMLSPQEEEIISTKTKHSYCFNFFNWLTKYLPKK